MLKNYLKASLATLWRMKWFSAFTLFSIAISLVVITCAASIWNMISAPIYPEVNKDRTFFLNLNFESNSGNEMINVYDLNMEVSDRLSKQDIYQFKTPELTCIYGKGTEIIELIRNNKTKRLHLMATDANFFKVFGFVYVAGKPYTQTDFSDEKTPICVISEDVANYYFGGIDCLGGIIAEKERKFKVCGVIKKPATKTTLKSDIYYMSDSRMGFYYYDIAFLCHSKNDRNLLDKELKKLSFKSDLGQFTFSSYTSEIQYLTQVIGFEKENLPVYCMIVFVALFIPVICLIDILRNNQTQRSEELAIRRAFGASRSKIANLLLVDNLFLTVMGGLLGLLFSFLFFAALNEDSWQNLFFVFFNWRSFFYYLATFLIIGAFAGLLPAYSLSNQQIVNALIAKEND